jgi:predicted phage baseplate assembly protein
VKAVYRTGIGQPGNVKAKQISLLVTRPLGLKAVTNPNAATGGADRESRDSARQNAPLALMALDRLVSVEDYEHFACTFAGIAKASAAKLSDGQRELVHVSIAGAADAAIDEQSDVFVNLNLAFRQFGDPFEPVLVAPRELLVLVISANVRLHPDYLWELVEPQVRAALLDAFGFDRRDLGQSVFLSEVISVIQRVRGVSAVDVNLLDSISEALIAQPTQLAAALDALVNAASAPGFRPKDFILALGARPGDADPQLDGVPIRPAQLAILIPRLPASLTLTEWTTP